MFGTKFPCLLLTVLMAACSTDPAVARQEFLESGDRYVAEAKLLEAIIEYRNAIRVDPKFVEARVKLAETYLKVGDAGGAFRELIRAADLAPDDAGLQIKAGNLLLLARQFEDAKGRADLALSRQPDQIDAQILRANALAGLNRIDDAIAEMEAAIARAPDRSTGYTSLGAMQLLRGDRAPAEAAFKKAVATDPKSVGARLALANFYWAGGQLAAAEAELKTAIALEPNDLLGNQALAYFYIGSGRAREAEPYLKTVAETSRDAPGKLMLADYYVASRRLEDARRVLEDVATTNPNGFADATLKLADLALGERNTATASQHVDAVLKKQPRHARALAARSHLQLTAGQLEEALASAGAAVAAEPQSVAARFALGRVQIARSDEAAAIASFNEALRLNPRMVTAQVELAKIHLASGRLDDAEQFTRAAIATIAGYADAHLLLARIHLLRGETAKAQPSLDALARAFPDSPAVQTEVGLLEFRKNNPVAARAAFNRALDAEPGRVDALAGLTTLDLRERRHDAAMRRLEAAMTAAPRHAALLRLAASTHASLDNTTAAERLLHQAIEADSNDLASYTMLGQLYAKERRLDQAVVQFNLLAERRPTSVAVLTSLGTLLQMQNRTEEARARYQQAITADPNAGVAANNLAWIYAEDAGSLDQALQLAQTAKGRLPDSHEVNDTLGWIYVKKGLGGLAIPLLRQSVRAAPRNPTYHYHLGMAYVVSGDVRGARASLEQSLALDPGFEGASDARRALRELKG